MHDNHSKLMGLYDELAMFLSQINICRGKGVADSHELAVFLQLCGANPWAQKTCTCKAVWYRNKGYIITKEPGGGNAYA